MTLPASPFSPQAISQAINTALNQAPVLPPGKSGALIVMATPEGVKAIVAAKIDDHWEFSAEGDYHGGAISGGVSVIASW